MKNTVRNYSLVFRMAWLTMALSMIVLCGPVKKLIQLHTDKNTTSQTSLEKKLHTGYRDRRDSSASINNIGIHTATPDDGSILFFFAAALAVFIVVSGKTKSQLRLISFVAELQTARFIAYRQLRI